MSPHAAGVASDGRDQLALVTDGGPAAERVPAPRRPPVGELRVVPELGAPGRELDTWRLSGRQARVLTPFSATACTGNAGLCGVCTGGPCQHALEHQHGQQPDQHDPEQEQDHEDAEREIEDEEVEP